MRTARALYFSYYAAMAAVLPFLALYYQDAGLSGAQIGMLAGLMPLMMMVGAPVWAEFADASGRHRHVLWLSLSASVVLGLGLSLVGSFLPLAVLVALVDVLRLRGGDARSAARGLSSTGRLGGLGHRFGAGLATMLRDVRWLVFLFTVFVGGMGLSLTLNFLPLSMREIGADLTLVGLSITAATLSELPILAFGGALLVRLGPRRMLILSLLAYTLRMALYPLIAVPEWILPVQLLHGPTFGVTWIAGVAYAKHLAPRGAGAAAQGLFTGVTMGLGGFSGGLFGGATYDWPGPGWVFGLAAALTLISAALMAGTNHQGDTPGTGEHGRTRRSR